MPRELDYSNIQINGLGHLEKHLLALSDKVKFFLEIISSGSGDPDFCMVRLRSHAMAAALVSWFKGRDLISFKQWCYVSGKLESIAFQREPKSWCPAYLLLMPLLSDHEGLIQWFSSNDQPFDMIRANDPATAEFHGYQALWALRGEWKTLEERCLKIIGNSSTEMKKYEIDHRFYLALSRQDVPSMEATLQELTSPKVAKVRNAEHAFGFTEKLIGTHAVICAKIAWRHGLRVRVDTPWIPEEWLPIEPLDNYLDPYEFMGNFKV